MPTAMSTPSNHGQAIAIAISLLKRHNPHTIQTLKNLLTFIPNPNHIRKILTTAVIELVDNCPQSALWLFQHPDVLEPEIDVREIIAKELTAKLLSWGYTANDFNFTDDYTLKINEATQNHLCPHMQPLEDNAHALICALLPK